MEPEPQIRFAALSNRGFFYLVIASAVYLTTPYFIYFAFWLQARWAVLAILVLLGGTFAGCLRLGRRNQAQVNLATFSSGSARPIILDAIVFALVIGAIGSLWGAGGYGPQDSDHPKHNAVFLTLVESSWPAKLTSDRGDFPLVYYLAYYLPAAVVGKLAGWTAANHALQLWSLTGLVLACLWFCQIAAAFRWPVLLLFAVFSGLDLLGALLLKVGHSLQDPPGLWTILVSGQFDWSSLKWWNWQIRWWDLELMRNYPSNVELFFFVPHQGLSGWITTALLVESVRQVPAEAKRTSLLWWGLSSLWSPFVTVGLTPIVGWIWLSSGSRQDDVRDWLRSFISVPNIAGIAVAGIIGTYYLSRWGALPFESDPQSGFGIGQVGWPLTSFLFRLALFFVLEIGVLAYLIWKSKSLHHSAERPLFFVSVGWLALLPFFRYGGCNDLVMRASIPAIFLIAAWTARAVWSPTTSWRLRFLLIVVLAIGACNPFSDVYAHVREILRRGQWLMIPMQEEIPTLWQMSQKAGRIAQETDHPLRRNFSGDTFFLQYIGSEESLFFRWIARQAPLWSGDASAEKPLGTGNNRFHGRIR